jgi:hypothetical protein
MPSNEWLRSAFPDPKQLVTVLFCTALDVQFIPNLTPAQTETGGKAAPESPGHPSRLLHLRTKPAPTSDQDWTKARADLGRVANDALAYVAIAPGNRAMSAGSSDPANCATAETEYRKALAAYPQRRDHLSAPCTVPSKEVTSPVC